ncbi:MAG: MGMT family protein, partial [Candidatus Thermoplasmatota archaeon]
MGEIEDEVYRLTAQIPRGLVSTYGAIAATLGDAIAARAVGRMMASNPHPITVPCHRVVMSDGSLGGYTGGIERKRHLLREEGVPVDGEKVIDFQRRLFTAFDSKRPLAKLKAEQVALAFSLHLADDFAPDLPLCALDVAYRGDRGWCAGLLTTSDGEKILATSVIEGEVDFP